MSRPSRIDLVGIPQHIIQRGNNRQVCFINNEDFAAYVHWLTVYARKFDVQIHAWVLMTNHVHLLCTPMQHKAISQMMQGLGRQYVRYFNKRHNRTGTLWEGRFKSCLVQQDAYLLEVYRYIELNPVRAGMVTFPDEYCWSSYRINALGKASSLCSPHTVYLDLGVTAELRREVYRTLVEARVDVELNTEIRKATNKGLVLGDESFKLKVEDVIGRRVTEGKRGRPLGWRKKI